MLSVNGIITGRIETAGNYATILIAENSKGQSQSEFTIVEGSSLALTPVTLLSGKQLKMFGLDKQ